MTAIIVLSAWYLIGLIFCIINFAAFGKITLKDGLIILIVSIMGIFHFFIYLENVDFWDNVILWQRRKKND